MINMDLVYKVAEQIDDHPEMYDQTTWAQPHDESLSYRHECGTAYCYAGWVCVVSGFRWNGSRWMDGEREVTNWAGTEQLALEHLADSPEDYSKVYRIFNGRFVHNPDLTPGDAFKKYFEGAELNEVGHTCSFVPDLCQGCEAAVS